LAKPKKNIQDKEFLYITGVIKSPKAQAAKTSSQYEVEKSMLRGFTTYSYWEVWRKKGSLNHC
jgi:hypothetical protein